MSQVPKVTWSLVVKDGMPFLTETLASIADQNYIDFQVFAWLNGSNDGTLEELSRWIPSRLPGRIQIEKSLPFAEAKSEILRASRSPLIANIDSDDVNLPGRLKAQVEFMDANPEVAAASCHFQKIDEAGNSIGDPDRLLLRHFDIVNGLLDPSPLCHPGSILRREMILQAGAYETLSLGEDFDLWIRLATQFQLANVDILGLNYRVRHDSMVRRARAEGVLQNLTAKAAAAHGQSLFGIDSSTILSLFQAEHSFAFPVLLKIARHLDQTQPGIKRLRSKSFVRSARRVISPKDLRTRLIFKVLRIIALG